MTLLNIFPTVKQPSPVCIIHRLHLSNTVRLHTLTSVFDMTLIGWWGSSNAGVLWNADCFINTARDPLLFGEVAPIYGSNRIVKLLNRVQTNDLREIDFARITTVRPFNYVQTNDWYLLKFLVIHSNNWNYVQTLNVKLQYLSWLAILVTT